LYWGLSTQLEDLRGHLGLHQELDPDLVTEANGSSTVSCSPLPRQTVTV